MRQQFMAISLMALLLEGLAGPSWPMTLSAIGPEVSGGGDYEQTIFSCRVAVGPTLAGCALSAPSSVSVARSTELTAWLEATPSCLLSEVATDPMLTVNVVALAQQPLARAPHYTLPDWDRAASGHIALDYPQEAYRSRAEGHVVLVCQVAANGTAENCNVESESPPGLRFGYAAMRLTRIFRFRPTMRDCQPIEGGKIKIPLHYTYPG
jgi:TonB family protein